MVRPASSDKWKALFDLPEIAKISTGKRRENIKKEKKQSIAMARRVALVYNSKIIKLLVMLIY